MTIATTVEEAIATHNRLIEEGHFTDGSGIEDEVGASAVTVFTSIPGEAAITLNKKQAFLGPLNEFTVYSGEWVGLELALKIIKDHPEIDKPIAIFTLSKPPSNSLANLSLNALPDPKQKHPYPLDPGPYRSFRQQSSRHCC